MSGQSDRDPLGDVLEHMRDLADDVVRAQHTERNRLLKEAFQLQDEGYLLRLFSISGPSPAVASAWNPILVAAIR